MDHVKPRRRYDSSGRQAQARRNQRAILDAAQRQFLQGGYAAFLADYMIATFLPRSHCPRPGP